MRVDTLTKIINSRPIGTLTIVSLLMGALSIASAELGRFLGYSPLHSMSLYYLIALLIMMATVYYFKVYKILWQRHISIKALIYGALWLLPVAYWLWLNLSFDHKDFLIQIGQVILSTAYQELFYRGIVLLLLINILRPKNYPFAYIVLVGAVLSALPQIYMLLTPAPLVYVLYQIIWATLYAMVAVYAMVLWRNIGVVIVLHAITQLYGGFNTPILGVPALYIPLLWFAILAIIGRILCKPHHMEAFLFNKEDTP